MCIAIIRCLPNSLPVVAYQLYRDAAEITPGLGKVINESFKSVLAPMPLKCLMDIDDAKECLNFFIKTVKMHAELHKIKAAEKADAAQRAEEQHKHCFLIAELPKFKGRTSKKLGSMPFVKYKLFGTYSYGYGFTPFLVPSCQSEQ